MKQYLLVLLLVLGVLPVAAATAAPPEITILLDGDEVEGETVAVRGLQVELTVQFRAGDSRIAQYGLYTGDTPVFPAERGITLAPNRDWLYELPEPRSRVTQKYLVPLVWGGNRVRVAAVDAAGTRTERLLTIEAAAPDYAIKALIVGISEYRSPQLRLKYAAADARALGDYFTSYLGLPAGDVRVLTDRAATREGILRALDEFGAELDASDVAVVFFAGHGVPYRAPGARSDDPYEGYLLPSDADPDLVAVQGIRMSDFSAGIAGLPCEQGVVILDACFSGRANGGRTVALGGRATGVATDEARLFEALGSRGRVVLSSSGSGESSLEDDSSGHGYFTAALIEALRGKGDRDRNGVISVSEAHGYIQAEVRRRTNRQQTPSLSGAMEGDILLAWRPGGDAERASAEPAPGWEPWRPAAPAETTGSIRYRCEPSDVEPVFVMLKYSAGLLDLLALNDPGKRTRAELVPPGTADGLAPGEWSVEAYPPAGWKPTAARVTVTAGRTEEAVLSLVRVTGTLVVTSDPVGLAVTVEGMGLSRTGTTRLELTGLRLGEYRVRSGRTERNAAAEQAVTIGSEEPVTVRLAPGLNPGGVTVRTEPLGAAVTANGQRWGTTSQRKPVIERTDLAPGRYTIRAELEGYEPATAEVTVEAGKLAPEVALRLTRRVGPASAAPAPPPTVSSGRLPDGFSAVGAATDPASGLPMRIRCDRINYELVLVPAGEFTMGSLEGDGGADEHPQHRVYLDAYYLGVTEVSNGQYRRFKSGQNSGDYSGKTLNDENQPVVQVSWEDAKAFCEWAGLALPTEAQWEKGARGTDGRKYPWGNQWPPPQGAGNYATFSGYNDGYEVTSPVGSFGASEPYGTRDMGGNVWEWCADWAGGDYYKRSPNRNPPGPSSGEYRVLRGASWYSNNPDNIRAAFRVGFNPSGRGDYSGFRGAVAPR